jgi:hypothetical protein
MPPAADEMSEPAPEEDAGIPGWFRIDTDSLATQLWVGATHDLGGVALASDIYVVGTFAELDLGIAFEVGPVALLPMVGIGFDFGTQEVTTLIAPQLFTIIDSDSVYFESWIQGFLNSPFESVSAGDGDSLYTRNFLLFKASDDFHIGPQMELTLALNDSAGDGLTSLQFGARTNIAYGENNTLGLFVGVETDDDSKAGNDDIVGRFTFIRTW